MLTNSTNPAIRPRYLSHPDHPKSPRQCHKTTQNQSWCHSCRRPRRKTVQSGAAIWSGAWNGVTGKHTCVATYAKEAVVTRVIPCMRAFPDLVALTSFSTELGEVKICLNACSHRNKQYIQVRKKWVQLTQTSNSFLKRPSQGSSGTYAPFS